MSHLGETHSVANLGVRINQSSSLGDLKDLIDYSDWSDSLCSDGLHHQPYVTTDLRDLRVLRELHKSLKSLTQQPFLGDWRDVREFSD